MMMKPTCGGQGLQDIHQVGALARRQSRCRLVEQDQARRARQGERDLELPLLAVAEFGHRRIAPVAQMDGVAAAFPPSPLRRRRAVAGGANATRAQRPGMPGRCSR